MEGLEMLENREKHDVEPIYARDITCVSQIPNLSIFIFGDKIYTVVEVYPTFNEIALSQQIKKPKKPILVKIQETIEGYSWDNFQIEPNNFHKRFPLADIKETQWDKAQKRFDVISSIVGSVEKRHESILDLYIRGHSIAKEIKQCSEINGVSVQSIYYFLNLYLTFGQNLTALLPDYYKCGKNRPLPESVKETGGKVLGNKCVSNNRSRRIFNKQDLERLLLFIERDLASQINFSIRALHGNFERIHCKMTIRVEGQHEAFKATDLSKVISYDQFNYHFFNHVDIKKFNEYKKGVKQAHNDDYRKVGIEQQLSLGPSHTYGIDSTTLNVYVVTRVLDNSGSAITTKRLGRPHLYLVFDVYSGCIAGYAITFRQNAVAAKLALLNAFSDKVTHCARWGVDIDKEDWLCEHVCLYVYSDRGSDYKESILDDTVKADLKIEGISYSPAYISRARGGVEVSMNGVDQLSIQWVQGRVKRKPSKDDLHPSTTSAVTIEQLHRLVIQAILCTNRSKINFSRLHSSDVLEDLSPIPNAVWKTHIQRNMGGGIRKSRAQVIYALLSRTVARVKKDCVELKLEKATLLYRTKDKSIINRQEQLKDRKVFFEIDLRFNPDDLRFAWYADPNQDFKIIKFELAAEDKRFSELIELEAVQRDLLERARDSEGRQYKEREVSEMAEVANDINEENEKFSDSSSGRMSMQAGIKENTDEARKEEIVEETLDLSTEFGYPHDDQDLSFISEGNDDED